MPFSDEQRGGAEKASTEPLELREVKPPAAETT